MASSGFERLNDWIERTAYGRFFRDLSIVSILRLLGGALLFASQVLLARWMSPEDFGVYSFAWTWVAILGALGGLGLAAASVRFLASYTELGRHDLARGLIAFAFKRTLLAALVVGLLGWVAFEMFMPGSSYLPAIRIAMLAVPVMAVLNVDAAFARGMQWMGIATLAEQVSRPVILMIIGVLLVATTGERSAVFFVTACLLAYLLATAAQHWSVHRRLAARLGAGPRGHEAGQWQKVSAMLLLLNGAQMLRMNGDPVIVGLLLGPADLGVYMAAVRTATLVSFALTITSVVAQPSLSALHARQDPQALKSFFQVTRRWTFLTSLLGALFLTLTGRFILSMFGPEYLAAYPALLILLAGHVLASAFGPVTSLLIMSDRQNVAAAVLVCAMLGNAILTVLLGKLFGIAGAALASVISLVAAQIGLGLATRGGLRRASLRRV